MINNIKFSHNWNNKLNNNIFTTIRNYSDSKYNYYVLNLNKDFDILLNGEKFNNSKLIDITQIKYSDIPIELLRLDIGISDPSEISQLFISFGMKSFDSKMLILTFIKSVK
jgi:hypothetical protein